MPRESQPHRSAHGGDARALALIALSGGVGSLGLAAGGTAGALAGAQLAGTPAAAGLPLGILVAGSAVAAALIARRTEERGRASGLSLGYAIGAAGALVVILALSAANIVVLLLGSFLLGAGNPAIFLTRYAGATAARPDQRARGLGVVFFATAVGAVIGPNLLGPSADLAAALGQAPLAGLYIVAIPAFGVAAVLLHLVPGIESRSHIGNEEDVRSHRQRIAALPSSSRAGLAVLTTANLVMVGVMAVAPVHLHLHGEALDHIGLIVGAHVLAMFGPAPLTGTLVDRLSPTPVVAGGAAILLASSILLATLDPTRPETLLLGVIVLGLGWNACVVGGSAMLTEAASDHDRPGLEGLGEIAMGLAAAVGTPAAGLAAGLGGLPLVATVGGAISVLLVGVYASSKPILTTAASAGFERRPAARRSQPLEESQLEQ
jgi:MFS family permease